MGQAIKIGGIDSKRMIGLWTNEASAQKNETSVTLNNPFISTDIIVEPFCQTGISSTKSVAVTSMDITSTTIKLNFDKLEQATSFKCKVYMK